MKWLFKYCCCSCKVQEPPKTIFQDIQKALDNNEPIPVINALINKAIVHLSDNQDSPQFSNNIRILNRLIIERNKREPHRGIILHLSPPPSNIKTLPKALVFRVKCEDCKKVNKVCGGMHNNVFAPATCPICPSSKMAIIKECN